MAFSPDTQKIMEQLEQATARPAYLQPDPALPTLATVKVARGDAPAHLITYRPDAQGVDYAVASQLGTVLRIFQSPPEDRFDLAINEAGRESVRRSLAGPNGTLTPYNLPEGTIKQAVYGLALKLEQGGGEGQTTEADGLYKRAIPLDPHSEIAERSRRALTRLAQQDFHAGTGLPVRMDSALYCLDGLRKFAKMTPAEVKTVAFEIGMLGAQGLDINSPAPKYTLRSLSGQHSGLQLMCLMYVGFQQIAPDQDIGFDLKAEYALAQQMLQDEGAPS